MAVGLGARRGIVDSRPDYEEAMALTRRLREQQVLGGRARAAGGLSRAGKVIRPESNVMANALGWGLGLGAGFWLCIVLVFRQFL